MTFSPCVGVCKILPGEKTCLGCFRTIEEIARWSSMTDEEREKIGEEILVMRGSIERYQYARGVKPSA